MVSSPRTRGSSELPALDPAHRAVLPAHAGVIRRCRWAGRIPWRPPRARGGHPAVQLDVQLEIPSSPRTRGSSRLGDGQLFEPTVLPAHAGVIPTGASNPNGRTSPPRARGGHPQSLQRAVSAAMSSPRTRGSSQLGGHCRGTRGVLPAHAGVIPPPSDHGSKRVVLPAHAGVIPAAAGSGCWCRRPPRARGGHPYAICNGDARNKSSPRTRGSSQPAIAGSAHGRCPPRARGGHPRHDRVAVHRSASSPRTRGSSRAGHGQPDHADVLPAHAGVIPGMRTAR